MEVHKLRNNPCFWKQGCTDICYIEGSSDNAVVEIDAPSYFFAPVADDPTLAKSKVKRNSEK
jgi:hypothetical protein